MLSGQVLTNASSPDRSKTDFYPTPADVTYSLIKFLGLKPGTVVWEPACGEGHMTEALKSCGLTVHSSELHDFGYGSCGVDFLKAPILNDIDWIITNPPFKLSEQFIKRCHEHGKQFALLLKSQYFHAARRLPIFNVMTPSHVLPLTWRPDFLFGHGGGSPTMEVIWCVWNKRNWGFTVYQPLERTKYV